MSFQDRLTDKAFKYAYRRVCPCLTESIRNAGLTINYIDIGGAEGAPEHVEWLAPITNITSCEPDLRVQALTRERLLSQGFKDIEFIEYCLSNEKSKKVFYQTRRQQCSSLYKPDYAVLRLFPEMSRFDIVAEISMTCVTLDDVELKGKPDWIKIDTQGSELDILKGGARTLESVLVVEVEVEFLPIYKDQPCFRDIDGYLNGKGFQLIQLDEAKWKTDGIEKSELQLDVGFWGKNQLVFGNAVYIRKSLLYPALEVEMHQRRSILIAALMLVAYRQFSLAVALVNQFNAAGVIEDVDKAIFMDFIKTWCYGKWYARLFQRMGYFMRKRKSRYYFDLEYS